ncbi:protein DENND6A-like isoform X2 [Branchiostoma lanceolatum]|uniref:protein DENND6A-like isoform X2 n=1 Tax=Branchiostoma lanceolatum TaxID=7740 RepID=UPI00345115C3
MFQRMGLNMAAAREENPRGPESSSFSPPRHTSRLPQSPTLPWDRFSNWLHCICVVTFDLELGQAMELIYPGHIKLSEKEKMNICYLSFPDSNSGCMGDTQFCFRIRQSPGRKAPSHTDTQWERDAPVYLHRDQAHYYGYVYFRQVKDKSSRRGYFQKSLVLITRLPFNNLFNFLAEIVAPEYFDNGEPCLEAACHDIDQWPSPQPGETLSLPMMGMVIQVRLLSKQDKLATTPVQVIHQQSTSPIPAPYVLPSLHEVDVFKCLHPVLPHVQMLWELVLTTEPIIVMAPSPTVCSETVLALTSMISPLNFCSDFRPYFTIHDSEFKEYTTKTQAPPPVVLGVTNPFFAKTLQHWPHIIRIGEMGNIVAGGRQVLKTKKSSSLKTIDAKPGVYTTYKPFLNKDKNILKRLQKGIASRRPNEVQTAMLKRYLLELTQSFMIPLERYVASLMPLQRNVSPWKQAPRLKPFEPEEFLKTVEHSGPQLTSGLRGDWEGLYRRFFRSSNFEGWLRARQQEVDDKLQALHLEALCDADLSLWIQGRPEVEVVDLVLKLREKMFAATNQVCVKDEVLQRLNLHLDGIIRALPEDLRSILKSS